MIKSKKRGLLTFEGSRPMRFVEIDDGEAAVSTPEEEEHLAAIGAVVKEYLRTTRSLSAGKYAHLQDKIPAFMRDPGQVLIALCTDGIAIRYELRNDQEAQISVAIMHDDIAHTAALLSQNLIHIASSEIPQPNAERFGVEIKLQAQGPTEGPVREILASRIWFQATLKNGEPQSSTGQKPYCLLSVRNEIVIELHGDLLSLVDSGAPPKPFIVRSQLRLGAGWDCIEVFPGREMARWRVEFAALWAENDLLGAALVAQTQAAQLSNLDPKAAARRQYASLLAEFKQLLDSEPDREQVLQSFLEKNPVLLCPTFNRVWRKLPFGATVSDFVFCQANQEYLLVELERSTCRLFRKDGYPTAELTHAQGQIVDWKRYLEDNLRTAQHELGLLGITTNPPALLVIGRSGTISTENRRKLQTMMNESPKLRISTYDDICDNARTVFENLLGPISDLGGSTQMLFPEHASGNQGGS